MRKGPRYAGSGAFAGIENIRPGKNGSHMTKREFLESLRLALSGKITSVQLAENLDYYEDYINTEIRKGRDEQEVLSELGDPRLIARDHRGGREAAHPDMEKAVHGADRPGSTRNMGKTADGPTGKRRRETGARGRLDRDESACLGKYLCGCG